MCPQPSTTPRDLHARETLQIVSEKLKREVGRDLRSDAQLSDTEFTVIANLRLADGEMRPGECARAIGWDSSRLAHQLRRLEKRGLVSKRPDEVAREEEAALGRIHVHPPPGWRSRAGSRRAARTATDPRADGRASVLVLTDEVCAAYRRAIGPHLRSAHTWFACAFTPTQLEGLATGLDALLAPIESLSASSSTETP